MRSRAPRAVLGDSPLMDQICPVVNVVVDAVGTRGALGALGHCWRWVGGLVVLVRAPGATSGHRGAGSRT